jgi:hypothetical protein
MIEIISGLDGNGEPLVSSTIMQSKHTGRYLEPYLFKLMQDLVMVSVSQAEDEW